MAVYYVVPADVCLVVIINLGTMFTIGQIPPETHSNGKQNRPMRAELIIKPFDVKFHAFEAADFRLQITTCPILGRGAGTLPVTVCLYFHNSLYVELRVS